MAPTPSAAITRCSPSGPNSIRQRAQSGGRVAEHARVVVVVGGGGGGRRRRALDGRQLLGGAALERGRGNSVVVLDGCGEGNDGVALRGVESQRRWSGEGGRAAGQRLRRRAPALAR
jgi:hypothetical protein